MTDEDKIKQMLISDDDSNRMLGFMYAKQFLGWGELKCIEVCLEKIFEVDFLKKCECNAFGCKNRELKRMDFELKSFKIYIQVEKTSCSFGYLSVRPLLHPCLDPSILMNDFAFGFNGDYSIPKYKLLQYLSYFLI